MPYGDLTAHLHHPDVPITTSRHIPRESVISMPLVQTNSTTDELQSRIDAAKDRIANDAAGVHKKLNSSCKVVAPPKRSKSVIDTCGIRVSQQETIGGRMKTKTYWLCLCGACGDNGVCKTVIATNPSSTSTCTNHLRGSHGTVSTKTQSRELTMKRIEQKMETARPSFQNDPHRWFEVHVMCVPAFGVRRRLTCSRCIGILIRLVCREPGFSVHRFSERTLENHRVDVPSTGWVRDSSR